MEVITAAARSVLHHTCNLFDDFHSVALASATAASASSSSSSSIMSTMASGNLHVHGCMCTYMVACDVYRLMNTYLNKHF